jgi:hypothetical protein
VSDDILAKVGFASGVDTPTLTVKKAAYTDLQKWLAGEDDWPEAIALHAGTPDGPRVYLLRRDRVEYVVAVEEAP